MSYLARCSRRYHEGGLVQVRSGTRAWPAKSDGSMIGFGGISDCLPPRDFQPRCDAPTGALSNGWGGVSQPPPSAKKRVTWS